MTKIRKGEFRIAVAAALAKIGAFGESTAVDSQQLAKSMGADMKRVSTALNALYFKRGALERAPIKGRGRGIRHVYWLKGRKPPKEGTVAAGTPAREEDRQIAEERQAAKRDERYGKEVMLQVPCGDGQTCSFNLKQATLIYRYLHAMRHLFKDG